MHFRDSPTCWPLRLPTNWASLPWHRFCFTGPSWSTRQSPRSEKMRNRQMNMGLHTPHVNATTTKCLRSGVRPRGQCRTILVHFVVRERRTATLTGSSLPTENNTQSAPAIVSCGRLSDFPALGQHRRTPPPKQLLVGCHSNTCGRPACERLERRGAVEPTLPGVLDGIQHLVPVLW